MAILSVRKTNGFGLLDLMLALIIASLLAALAVPVYGQYAKETAGLLSKRIVLIDGDQLAGLMVRYDAA